MTTDDAFEIVLDLARQNILTDKDARGDEALVQAQDRQIHACDMVEDFFVNNIAE